MHTFMTATEARKHWYATIQNVQKKGNHVIITHEGLPKVAMVSFKEFEGWKRLLKDR